MSLSGGAGLSSCLSWRLIPCLLSFYDAAPSGPRALSERPYDSKPPRTAAFTEAWHGPNHLVARNRSGTGAAEKHASQYRSIHSRSYSRYNQYRSPYDYYRYDDSGPEKRHWEHRPYREDEKAEQAIMFVMIGFFLVATLIMACGLTAQCGLGLCRERKRQFDIALLPTVKWQANSTKGGAAWGLGQERPECSLCLDPLEDGDTVMPLKCSHVFHAKCIRQWFEHTKFQMRSCPLCKANPLDEAVHANGSVTSLDVCGIVVSEDQNGFAITIGPPRQPGQSASGAASRPAAPTAGAPPATGPHAPGSAGAESASSSADAGEDECADVFPRSAPPRPPPCAAAVAGGPRAAEPGPEVVLTLEQPTDSPARRRDPSRVEMLSPLRQRSPAARHVASCSLAEECPAGEHPAGRRASASAGNQRAPSLPAAANCATSMH